MKPFPEQDGSNYGEAAFTWFCLMIFFNAMNIGVMGPIAFMFMLFFGGQWAYRKITGVGGTAVGAVRSFVGGAGAVTNGAGRQLVAAGRHVAAAGHQVADAAHAVRSTVATAVFPVALNESAAPTLTRWTHWTGAAPLAAIIVVLTTFAASFVTANLTSRPMFDIFRDNSPRSWAGFTAFVTSAIAACWTITAICKFWEGRSPSGMSRRLSLGIAGLLVGAIGGGLSAFMAIDGPSGAPFGELTASVTSRESPARDLVLQLQRATSIPATVFATALVVGALFALRNWSRQTDESRPSRFRLRSLMATVFVAWLSGVLFGVSFSPGLLVWAAIVSSAVQLASVWRPASPASSRKLA